MSIANRGLASMSPERRRQIASMGGKAAHAAGTAHEFTTAEAQQAGSKGGAATLAAHGNDYLQSIGRTGGLASGYARRRRRGLPVAP